MKAFWAAYFGLVVGVFASPIFSGWPIQLLAAILTVGQLYRLLEHRNAKRARRMTLAQIKIAQQARAHGSFY